MNLFAQPPLRADAKAVTDNQHPDHQLRINRRPTHFAVKRRQLAPHSVELDKPVDRTQQMFRRHMTFQRKLVEQSVLPAPTFPHHRFAPQSPTTRVNQPTPTRATPSFSTQSADFGHSWDNRSARHFVMPSLKWSDTPGT